MITVRSAAQEELLTREFELHSDRHTRAAYGFLIAHRWFGLRLDLLCAVYTIITLFACIALRGKHSSSSQAEILLAGNQVLCFFERQRGLNLWKGRNPDGLPVPAL